MNSPDVAEFLLVRVAEDEETARAAEPGPWMAESVYVDKPQIAPDERVVVSCADSDRHGPVAVARHDPARVLAECAAKRAIVAKYERASYQAEHDDADLRDVWDEIASTLEQVVMLHAQVYAGHPDYRPEWTVTP